MSERSQRVTFNPNLLAGKPTIRGLRISVEQVLSALAHGVPEPDLLADYPELEHDDILACLEYATRLVAEAKIQPVSTP